MDSTALEYVVAAEAAVDGKTLVGAPASAGYVTGRARVVRAAVRSCVRPGEILVVPKFDRQWLPLLGKVVGVVAETGNVLSNPVIVAREFRVPVVLGATGATARIATGEIITVDGAIGRVHRGCHRVPVEWEPT